MQMLSERGFNIHIYPMIQKRGRTFEGGYVKTDNKMNPIFMATEDSRWNLRCYKFMDYMSGRLRQKFDDKIYNMDKSLGYIKTLTDQRLEPFILLSRPDLIRLVVDGVNNPTGPNKALGAPYIWNPKITIKEAAKDLGWMKSHVVEVIKMISNYKFKTEYNFLTARVYGKTVMKNYKYSYNNLFEGCNYEPMFNVEFSDDKSECLIKLNTGFSICFLHNIYVGGYQLIDKSLYKLSESAQILYRKRFLTYSTLPKVYLELSHILDFLGLGSKNKTVNYKTYERIINEIIENTNVELVEKLCKNRYLLSKGVKKKDDWLNVRRSSYDPLIKPGSVHDITNRELLENVQKRMGGEDNGYF